MTDDFCIDGMYTPHLALKLFQPCCRSREHEVITVSSSCHHRNLALLMMEQILGAESETKAPSLDMLFPVTPPIARSVCHTCFPQSPNCPASGPPPAISPAQVSEGGGEGGNGRTVRRGGERHGRRADQGDTRRVGGVSVHLDRSFGERKWR